MKFTISTILSASVIVASAAATPSYIFRVNSNNPAIKDAVITVQDESATTNPTPLGVWSSGNPRNPYTFSIVPNPANPRLFEIRNTVKQTHAILEGPESALRLLDVPIGADPVPGAGEKLWYNTFMWNTGNQVRVADGYTPGGDPEKLLGPGSWRACKGDSEIDYHIRWYDGRERLEDIVKGCESIQIYVDEVKPATVSNSSTITGVPAPTTTADVEPESYITGVPAPVEHKTHKRCWPKTFAA